MTPGAKSDLIGQTIAGKFVIESSLGGGAMASVFKARHLGLGTTIALKVMHRSLAIDPLFAARFHREAQTASRLDHPNSIRVIDFGEGEDDLLYIAMELVDGRDLHEVIVTQWPLGDERVIRILSQVLAALAVAHGMGIVHRDLKPENIMIVRGTDDDGNAVDVVKVCDFGIAKIAEPRAGQGGDEQPNITGTGFIVGTPEYMAPEQARGEPVDARADLYAIGVILYRLLTRVPPFSAESALGVAVKHIFEEPPPPSARISGVSPRLEAICLKAMKKLPGERYQTAREMRADLRALLGPRDTQEHSDPFRDSVGHDGGSTPRPPLEAVPETPPRIGPSPRAASVIEGAATLVAPLGAATAPPASPEARAGSPPPALRARALRRAVIPAAALGAVLLALGLTRRTGHGASSSAGAPDAIAATAVPQPENSAATPPAANEQRAATAPAATDSLASALPPRPTSVLAIARGVIARPEPSSTSAAVVSAAPSVAEPPPSIRLPATTALPVARPPADPSPPAIVPTSQPPDIEAAHVSLAGVTTTSALSASSVRNALGHAAFTRCYKDALRASGAAAAQGTAALHLAIDDTGHVSSATVTGLAFLPGARACIEGAARGVRVPNVDTGEATANATLVFSLK